MNLTINELARNTGISAYEIRRRVHNGTLPHMRVGVKQTKILINEAVFNQLLAEESVQNMAVKHENTVFESDCGDKRLRKID